jgi:hypothetical protein
VSLYDRCKLAFVASRFKMPPTPSQALFPWDVAKKCHFAGAPKSSLWHVIFSKLFLFLYWAADPSEEQTIFFSGDSNVFSINFITCRLKVCTKMESYFKESDIIIRFSCSVFKASDFLK